MISRLALTIAIAASLSHGDSSVELHNQCAVDFDLVHVDYQTATTDHLVAGTSITKTIRNESPSHVFKSGTGAQATCTCRRQRLFRGALMIRQWQNFQL